MGRLEKQINVYIGCLLASLGLHLMVHGLPFAGPASGVALLAGTGLVLLFGALRGRRGEWAPARAGWLTTLVVLAGAGGTLYPVFWPNALDGVGLAHAVETTRLWPQVLVCLSGGLVLAKSDAAKRQIQGCANTASVAPYLLFGLALAFGFYALVIHLRATGTPQGSSWLAGTFVADTPIHYLIVAVFFVIFAYIGDALLRLKTAQPLNGSIRTFIRLLIASLPLLGFLGTVVGIMEALSGLPQVFSGDRSVVADLTPALTASLGGISLAFQTTLLGLVASLVTTLALGYVEKAEADAALRAAPGKA
ncbi:MotA/TolQ/ExbB proton channel family protein [Breoghania sp. JC706]|uniref:MotA/TolQ/ExbB proton channel family protein n=1 Tax=Breoghania sp. JC706 TaxID=3117732 RepID=UPI00300B9B5E